MLALVLLLFLATVIVVIIIVAVTVHGRAALLDVGRSDQAGFRQTLLEIYVPRYGQEWESFLDSGVVYARIDAERMFNFHMAEGS